MIDRLWADGRIVTVERGKRQAGHGKAEAGFAAQVSDNSAPNPAFILSGKGRVGGAFFLTHRPLLVVDVLLH
jgi:hypothetical protein